MPTYPGIVVYGGDIISSDDINANIPIVYAKANTDGKTSNTTIANDLELVGMPLDVGVYQIEVNLFWNCNTVSTALATQWAFTGSWNNPNRMCIGPGDGTTANNSVDQGANIQAVTMAGYAANASTVYNQVSSTRSNVVWEKASNVIVTAAGTLSLQWAQTISNATTLNVVAGSNFTIRKISN